MTKGTEEERPKMQVSRVVHKIRRSARLAAKKVATHLVIGSSKTPKHVMDFAARFMQHKALQQPSSDPPQEPSSDPPQQEQEQGQEPKGEAEVQVEEQVLHDDAKDCFPGLDAMLKANPGSLVLCDKDGKLLGQLMS